ncbi:hypothetical protein BOTBODRAFT_259756 [Botryobasidium botryosum FD-172 SS1]|uniref:Uncharacterized protein n=1 Tax=Botryobasidium botryosum (strain FD-172 SS1) TaxID=930990 RepID=A0A067MXT3_BOTB1|nr:hypothetical protein BOTBODRAFT_259756 [Botryobasidium botryosum FD-172 SS1]
MDATFFASQTDSGQTRPPPAPDGVRSTSSTPVPPTSTNANPPELPREKHEPTRATAQPPTTSSDLESLASTSSNIPSLSYPSALHPSDFMTSTTPLTPMSAAPTSSSASPHEPSSSTALTSTSPPGSPAPGSMDDPALQAALLNILLSSASGRQRILDVFTPQVTTQLSPPDPTPQPPIPQQFQPPPANNMAPHFFPDINPSSYLPDPQSQITPSPQPPLDSSLNSLWNMFGAFGAGAQLDPSFTNMDTTSHVNSLTQSNAQLQRTFQSAAEVDNRINTLQSYLEGYVPNSGIPDASLPSEFDASNFFDSFGAGELDAHLDAQQLGDAFDLGPEVADEDQSTTPTSHLGAYVDEVGSASATSSPKVPSVNWNDPIIEKEVDPDWVAGGAGVAAAGGGGGGQKRKPGANGTTDESTGGVPPEPPKKKTKSKKKS